MLNKRTLSKQDFIQLKCMGKQDLRFMILFFYLFILCINLIEYFVLTSLFSGTQFTIDWLFMIQIAGTVLLWLFACIALWKYSKFGKFMFILCALLNLFTIKQLITLFSLPMEDSLNQIIRVLFGGIVIGKYIISLGCVYRLLSDFNMRLIWKSYLKDIQGAKLMDLRKDTDSLGKAKSTVADKSSPSRLNDRAKHDLRKTTVLLFSFLYGSLIVFYLFMLIIRNYNLSDVEGTSYVQRTILLSCLYTALIWSLPALCIMLYKKWAKYLIFGVWILELIHITTTCEEVFKMVFTQNYGMISLCMYIFIEVLRYGMLLKITLDFIQNPFIKAYWSKRKIKKESAI